MKEYYKETIEKINANYGIMCSMRPLPQAGIDYFVSEMGISVAHNSNALEGNTFTFDETRLLLEKGITSSARTFREHEDIVGYKQGFDFLYRAVKEKQPINEEFIKTLHGHVLRGSEEAGKYRTVQNYVGSLTKVVYTPAPPSQVPVQMKEYVEQLQGDLQKYSSLREAKSVNWEDLFHSLAAHHIEFEKIHPFIDGNGRTGRLLLTYEMISMGLLPVDIRYEERARYNAAFTSYDVKKERSTRPESKTEKMADLLAECELRSMEVWNKTFSEYQEAQEKNELAEPARVGAPSSANEQALPTISPALKDMVTNMPSVSVPSNGANNQANAKKENVNEQ